MRRGSPRLSGPSDAVDSIHRLRQRIWRDRWGLFYAEGVRFLVKAAEEPDAIDTLVVSWRLLQSIVARKLVRRLRREGTRCISVTPEVFREVCHQPRASGVGVIARQQWSDLAHIDPRVGCAWLVLRHVRSPGNLGTLLRTLAGVAGGGVILLGDSVDAFDPTVVRATMGAMFGLRVIRTTDAAFNAFKKRSGCVVIGTSPSAETDYRSVCWQPGTLVFLGSERKGLSEHDAALCDVLVRIPMAGDIDSLNLGVAGSLMLYEAFRNQ